MTALVLQIFVSLVLVAGAVLLYVHSVKRGDREHTDRASLFPLDDDDPRRDRPRGR